MCYVTEGHDERWALDGKKPMPGTVNVYPSGKRLKYGYRGLFLTCDVSLISLFGIRYRK